MASLLRCLDPDAMRDEMEARHPGLFNEWLGFYQLEPWGHAQDDLHEAAHLAVLVNAATGGKWSGKRRTGAWTAADFAHTHGPQPARKRRRSGGARRMTAAESAQFTAQALGLPGPPPEILAALKGA